MPRLGWAITITCLLALIPSVQADDWEAASGIRTEPAPHQPTPWHIRLTLQPNFGLPLGTYYQNFEPGLGYGAELSVYVSKRYALHLMVSRSGIGHSTTQTGLEPPVGELMGRNSEETVKAWRASAAVEIHNWPGFDTGGRSLYSVYVGAGIVDNIYTRKVTFFDSSHAVVMIYDSRHTDRQLLLDAGGSVMIAIARHFGVNMGAGAQMVCVTENTLWTTYILDLKLGIVFLT